MKNISFLSALLLSASALSQTTNNPGVPIFGNSSGSSSLVPVFASPNGQVATPANFDLGSANGIVNSPGATNSFGQRVAFLTDIGSPPSTLLITTPGFGPASTNRNGGVPSVFGAQFQSGSASAFYDLPIAKTVLESSEPRPWIGVITTDSRQQPGGNLVYQYQTNLDQLVTMANYFFTSGISSVMQSNGTAPNIWVDQLWYSNHLAGGLLVPLQSKFNAVGFSNTLFQVHTNGSTATFHIYQYPGAPNQTNGDTELDFAQSTPNTVYTWPSQNTALIAQPYWFPLMGALNTRSWVDWAYSQGIDGIVSADCVFVPSYRGYDYWRASSLFDAIMYPNLGVRGEARDRWDLAYPWIKHPIWLGSFIDQPHAADLTEVNNWCVDQVGATVGTGGGLTTAMAFWEQVYNTANLSNAPANVAIPTISANDFTTGTSPTWVANDYTNFYSMLAIGHGNAAMAWTREAGSWNTAQNGIVTNSGFLNVWLDQPRYMPVRTFDNGSNTVWFNRHSSGDFLLFAENRGNTTASLNIDLGQAGFIPTNGVAYDVIPVFGGIYTGLPITNFFSTNLAANASIFWRLRKVQPWQDFHLQNVSQLASGGALETSGGVTPFLGIGTFIQFNNSSEIDAELTLPTGNYISNILFQASFEAQNAATWTNIIQSRWYDTSSHQNESMSFSNHIAANSVMTFSWTNHFTNDLLRQIIFTVMPTTNTGNAYYLDKLHWRPVPQ